MKIHSVQVLTDRAAQIRGEALVAAASYSAIAASTFSLAREARAMGASPWWQTPALLGIAAAFAVPYVLAVAASGLEWRDWDVGARATFVVATLPFTMAALMALVA